MTTHWDDNENDGIPDDDMLLDAAVAEARTTPNEIHDALLGMIGLVQQLCTHCGLSEENAKKILLDRRYVDARAVALSYL
jgi:hypothetical protein